MNETTELPYVPSMGAETGYELDETHVPLRISGYLCLIFGILSVFCLLGAPMLFLPIIGLFFGLFALRRSDGPTPAGIKPAMLGLLLVVGFGTCGALMPLQKWLTLGSQAEYFAKQYVQVIGRGEFMLAMQLKKDYINRLPTEMPLEEHYRANEMAQKALTEFTQDSVNQTLLRMGPDVEWTLLRPIRLYHTFGAEKADVYLVDRKKTTKLYLILKYQVDPRDGSGQWMVENCGNQLERIVAESVL